MYIIGPKREKKYSLYQGFQFVDTLMPSMYIRKLIFSSKFVNLFSVFPSYITL